MKHLILLIISCGLFLNANFVCAQEQTDQERLSDEAIEKIRVNLSMNPFKPQIPKKKVEPVNVPVQQPQRYPPVNPPKQAPINRMNPGTTQASPTQSAQQNQTLPFVEPVVTLPPMDISGLIWDSERPQAIINHKIVDIGDVIDDVKIIDIYKQGVTAEYQGKEFTITP